MCAQYGIPYVYMYVNIITVHIPIHVNIWDPILCAHLGTCFVLKLTWWWLHEQPKHVTTRDLTLYLLTIEIVVSGRKYTYVLYCHTTGWHPLRPHSVSLKKFDQLLHDHLRLPCPINIVFTCYYVFIPVPVRRNRGSVREPSDPKWCSFVYP